MIQATVCRSTLVLILAVSGFVPIAGCSGTVEKEWSEYVALDNGDVISVNRYVRFTESNSISGDAYSSGLLQSTLSFTGALSEVQPWDYPLVPLVLYRDGTEGAWVVVATSYSCEVWAARGSPKPPYWEFRLNGEVWNETPLSNSSLGRPTNLFFDFEPSLKSHTFTLEMKKNLLNHSDFANEYRSIVANIKSNCMPVRS